MPGPGNDIRTKIANASAILDQLPDSYYSFTTGPQKSVFGGNVVNPVINNANSIGPQQYNQIPNWSFDYNAFNIPKYNIVTSIKPREEEEEEYDAGKDWENAELERRNAIQQQFEPLKTPDYGQQAITALNATKKIASIIKPASTANAAASTANAAASAANAAKLASVAKGFNIAGAAAGIAAEVGDNYLNKSYKDNQGAYVGSAFGKNQYIDDVYNTNTAISSTNFNDAQQQLQGLNKQLNSQKTTNLSNSQRWGLVGVGAGKGAATGATIGSLVGPIGTIVGTAAGTVIGATAGALKGHFAKNKIRETNEAVQQKKIEANNYMQKAMSDIRQQNVLRNKQNIYNMSAYNNAYGGNLYANGGALQDPYGINYFGNGQSHEKNPYGGIPVSIAEDGKPNLVEEGEVLYNDYVFSKRIKITDSIRRRFKFNSDVKTFADAAKEIQERGKDRPNDSVTERTIKAHMQLLQSKQEETKEKQEQREQQKMLTQMNEQQLQAMQEQQMNEQADAYEQQMLAEQQAQMAQQQMPQENISQKQMMAQQEQPATLYAKGGKLKGGTNDIDAHRFAGEDEDEPQGYNWDDFTINADTYDFANKGNSKYIWDYGHRENEEANPYYAKTFKVGDDGYFDENEYSDYYNNALNWAKNLSEEDKEAFMEEYKRYYKEKQRKDFNGDFDQFIKWASDHKWGNNHIILSDLYDHFNPQKEVEGDPQKEVLQSKKKSNWMEYVPLGIDAYLAARSFAPVDYSRANAIMNTPIRDIQYTPNGGKIAPYIIDPRLQYMANYANAQATNRAIQNNYGGNGIGAVAAMLANNYNANLNAGNIGFQADAQNAAQIQAAQQFNNTVDARNSEGFLQAASANQQADNVRGQYRMQGLSMKNELDAARGQAISTSMGAIADDIQNLNNYQYNKNWNAALAGSGYYGNLTPEGKYLLGITQQNIPQAELDRQNAIQIAQMQSEDARLAREQQERINKSQLDAMAEQAAMYYPYYE